MQGEWKRGASTRAGPSRSRPRIRWGATSERQPTCRSSEGYASRLRHEIRLPNVALNLSGDLRKLASLALCLIRPQVSWGVIPHHTIVLNRADFESIHKYSDHHREL